MEALKDDPQVIMETWIYSAWLVNSKKGLGLSSRKKGWDFNFLSFFLNNFEGVLCFEISQAWAPK